MAFTPSDYGNANREDFYSQLMLTTYRPGSGYGMARPNAFPIGLVTTGIQTAGGIFSSAIGASQQGSTMQHQGQLAELSADIERERIAAAEREAAEKRKLVMYGLGAASSLGVLTLLVLAWRRS